GMTELCSSAFTTYPYHNEVGSVGYPHPFNNVLIYDEKNHVECRYNEIGEVCIQSPTEMLGYLDNDEENHNFHRLHPDGSEWIHTGDLGYINEDGQLFISGRIKRLFLMFRNGRALKVFPNAVEDALGTCELVEEICVVPDHSDEFNRPKAFVQLKPGREASIAEEELKALAEEKLADFMRPYAYEFREKLPRTDIDKVDFTALERETAKKL
ncbi:MAG: acyl--CoA ligase, partial [Clostridia bacterium]|nr:acyl--CoA ligase [Clostridia bacterium]